MLLSIFLSLLYLSPSIFASSKFEIRLQRLACLINYERNKNGELPPLGIEAKLNAAAEIQSQHQAEIEDITHTGPNGSNVAERVESQDFSWMTIAENVAFGRETSVEVVNDWMCSPHHQANILNPRHTMLGASAYQAGRGVVYWTLVLGSGAGEVNIPECSEFEQDIKSLETLDNEGCGK